jgi:hypothetical protein
MRTVVLDLTAAKKKKKESSATTGIVKFSYGVY